MKLLILPLTLLFLSVACNKTPEDVSQQRAEAREEFNDEMRDTREEMEDIHDEQVEDYLEDTKGAAPRDEERRIDAVE